MGFSICWKSMRPFGEMLKGSQMETMALGIGPLPILRNLLKTASCSLTVPAERGACLRCENSRLAKRPKLSLNHTGTPEWRSSLRRFPSTTKVKRVLEKTQAHLKIKHGREDIKNSEDKHTHLLKKKKKNTCIYIYIYI